MDFTINCPVDGMVDVAIEDIDTVVLRAPERAEIIFSCPKCGIGVSVMVQIPGFLLATIDSLSPDNDAYSGSLAGIAAMAASADRRESYSRPSRESSAGEGTPEQEARIDAYCEYFRRQLAGIDDVKDMLREMSSAE
ncbi:MAG: hypothetical protein M1617_00830 [Actinobacteria bacterium]|nr:hypothetical protein [Actinomycetota bacterium]MCL5886840.1 hypothetical protein [Actinomycetota bacterium]